MAGVLDYKSSFVCSFARPVTLHRGGRDRRKLVAAVQTDAFCLLPLALFNP